MEDNIVVVMFLAVAEVMGTRFLLTARGQELRSW